MSRGTLDTASFLSLSPTGLSPSLAGLSRAIWLGLIFGSCAAVRIFTYVTLTLFGVLSHTLRLTTRVLKAVHTPNVFLHSVWPLPRSLAATYGITVVFFSSGYLDVSVRRVPLHNLWIQLWIHEVFSCGFPHSEIHGSRDICSSPWLFAAYHVFLRLLVPRHPPCALISLTNRIYSVRYFGSGSFFLAFLCLCLLC